MANREYHKKILFGKSRDLTGKIALKRNGKISWRYVKNVLKKITEKREEWKRGYVVWQENCLNLYPYITNIP